MNRLLGMLVALAGACVPATAWGQSAAPAGGGEPPSDDPFGELSAAGSLSVETPPLPEGPPPAPPPATLPSTPPSAPPVAGEVAFDRGAAEARAARLEAYDRQWQRSGQRDLESSADEQDESEGVRRHDGFLFRLTLGAGMGGLRTMGRAFGLNDDWRSGPVGYQGLSLGGAIADNWLLHADVHGFVDGHRVEYDNPIRATGWLGVGLSYYFMPDNLYLGASLGPAAAYLADERSLRGGGRRGELAHEPLGGLGAGLFFGKEWWVHDNWGLGIAAGLLYTFTAGQNEREQDMKLHSGATTLSLSLTYN